MWHFNHHTFKNFNLVTQILKVKTQWVWFSGSMLGFKWGEYYSDTPGNRRSLVQTPACGKHPLGRGHTSIASSPGVVAHFGPLFFIQKKNSQSKKYIEVEWAKRKIILKLNKQNETQY